MLVQEGLFNGLEIMFEIISALLHELFGGLRMSTLQAETVGESNNMLHNLCIEEEGLFNDLETISRMVTRPSSNIHKLLIEREDLSNDLEMVSKRGRGAKSSVHKLFGGLFSFLFGDSTGNLLKPSVGEEGLFPAMVIHWLMDKLFAEAETLFNSLESISKMVRKSKNNLFKLLNNFVQ